MRINQYVARATGLSRRSADKLIIDKQVSINGRIANIGDQVAGSDNVSVKNKPVYLPSSSTVLMLNKPIDYVCSRNGQGSNTIYDLLPQKYHKLKVVGRLDKNSSGLILLTDDGQLANKLLHPSFEKEKIYIIRLNKILLDIDLNKVMFSGVKLSDGVSKFTLTPLAEINSYKATLKEGRNRQIRRTFEKLNYKVLELHRIKFGPYDLGSLEISKYKVELS